MTFQPDIGINLINDIRIIQNDLYSIENMHSFIDFQGWNAKMNLQQIATSDLIFKMHLRQQIYI